MWIGKHEKEKWDTFLFQKFQISNNIYTNILKDVRKQETVPRGALPREF